MFCVKCNINQEYITKGKRAGYCKKCWRQERNANCAESRKKWQQAHKNDPERKVKRKEYEQKYRASKHGKDHIKQLKLLRKLNKEKHDADKAQQRQYYKEHKQERIGNTRKWEINNPEKVKLKRKQAGVKRKQDPLKHLSDKLRSSFRTSLKKRGINKSDLTYNYLGYEPKDLYKHLSKYLDKMCELCNKKLITANQNHIDHIVPLHTALTLEDVIILNQLTNLRLICPSCNLNRESNVKEKYPHGRSCQN